MPIDHSRRRFLSQLGIAGFAGVGGLVAAGSDGRLASFAADRPPEVTTLRMSTSPATCLAAQYMAEDMLRTEGFTDIRYLPETGDQTPTMSVASGRTDWDLDFSPGIIADVDKGASVTMVAGIHPGCVELFAQEDVRSVIGLKNKTVAVPQGYYVPQHIVSLMAKNVGLSPDRDIRWAPADDPMAAFVNGGVDAFLATAPEAQELRERKIGHSVVNTATDRPWSQYYCCILIGRTEFVRKYPVATKRIVRAYLKATDLCVSEPERVARLMVERGHTPHYDYALQTLRELPYGVWRDFDPEDTVRFYALRLNEAGFTKSDPQPIIARNTNWSFLNEVRRELKA